ncbi:peptidoglycan bridge formation glycyltransferase FemA/FemB family protein [Ferrovibrio sp.]|uniref:peptidoglycan bridge formation glycyltransferase FemA/FemB family protein n=1 Tax=Ferrovibrio sp. TaxID=1917215 RepID=UPI002630D040|nr:peptidoglycan bridge formation glycyltransferase FemA/FemB family protein [Ferrovibrio sp.]
MQATIFPEQCDSAAVWIAAHDAMRQSVLEQSWCYGEAVASASAGRVCPERWLFRRQDRVIALAQVFARRIGPLGCFIRLVRGPLFAPGLDRASRDAVLTLIRMQYPWRQRRLLWWLPELNGGSDSETTMARLGLRPMVSGYSSIRMDLTPPLERLRAQLDGKWRNTLKTAEKSALLLEVASRAEGTWHDEAFTALMGEHDEHRLENRFLGPDAVFYSAFADAVGRSNDANEDALLLWAHAGLHLGKARPIAGILVLRHGRGATYAMGWSNEAGRLVKAHYRLIWRAMAELKSRGVTQFDLGGVDTERGAGVARFKLGLGGEVFTLAGSFV